MRRNDYGFPLTVGSSFIFQRNYCIVKKMKKYHFEYEIQNSTVRGFMTYDYYLTTPSFKGRQRKL